ncbi:MAG: histidine phosphatase family protein, partial [Caldilineaceae bacterium]|nr:histidine phosphatase family protein [Caldilineaceae bacterium]
ASAYTFFWDHDSQAQLDLHKEIVDDIAWPGAESERTVEATLVRHGETDWNRDKRIQGHTDIALNATGYRQAQLVAMALPELVALATIACFRSSPLLRARQTMDCLASIHAIDSSFIGHDPDLRELSFGVSRDEASTSFAPS